MSADNGVYVLITRDSYKITRETDAEGYAFEYHENTFGEGIIAYRVAHAQAIDNLYYLKENQPYMVGKFLYDVWEKSPVFYDMEEAYDYAQILHRDIGWTEYGICTINEPELSFT